MRRFWRRFRRPTVLAATANPEALKLLWQRARVQVREARTWDGVYAGLADACLIVMDERDLAEGRLSADYVRSALGKVAVPRVTAAGFLVEPERWLAAAAVSAGQVRSLFPRLVTFTALASGGVGKTTLTLGLALSVSRRARLPVAVVELTHGASGFLTVLDVAGFTAPPADAYAIITQDAAPGVWRDLTVVPMDGRQGALLTPDSFATLLKRLREQHVLVVVDAVQPHPLWPAVDAAADLIFVVASAERPDTMANAHTWLAEQTDAGRYRLVFNMAGRLDNLAVRLAHDSHVTWLSLPRSPAIARHADPLTPLVKTIWPEWR